MRSPRTDTLILIAIGILLAAVSGSYYVLRHAPELNLNLEADKLLLAVLTIVMALLVVALAFLVLRNLIKLLVERRRRVLGSRFRTKLVFIFIALVFLPSVVLFYGAVDLIQRVNENLFTEPLEQISRDSSEVVEAYTHLMRQDCLRFASRIASEITARRLLEPERTEELRARAADWLAEDGLEYLVIRQRGEGAPILALSRPREGSRGLPQDPDLDPGAGPAGPPPEASPAEPRPGAVPDGEAVGPGPGGKSGPVPGEGAAPPPAPIGPVKLFRTRAIEAIESGRASHFLDRLGGVLRAGAVAPIRPWSPFGQTPAAVIAGRYISQETAERTIQIDRSIRSYKQNVKNRGNIKRITILLFAILTLTVLFAATWTGFYLARQITVPIQALAEGTRAISSGDLDHRVTAQAGDEIGDLIESFNRMTGELKSSREAIEESRRQLEASFQELEERRQYIEQLLENVPAAVISLDGRGNVSTMNRAAFRILGLDPFEPVLGMRAAEVFGREELAPLLAELEELPAREGPAQVQEFELSIGGRPVHLAASLSPRYDSEGRCQGSLVVLEDLTPLIRAQRTAAWREVARRMAHEIKNPLTPIQLSAQRILKKFHESASEFPRIVEEGVNTIVQEVTTLKSLVDEFSRFAQMPAVSPVPMDPNAVIESALSLYDGTHPDVRFMRDLEGSAPPVPLDAEQMKRALINLIDNAIAALEGRGAITLTSRAIPGERLFRIEVADTGPGIEPQNKDRLFLPYFSTKKRGTGLGLAIVNRIISEHNGFIRVEDNHPRGARFVIDLPLA